MLIKKKSNMSGTKFYKIASSVVEESCLQGDFCQQAKVAKFLF